MSHTERPRASLVVAEAKADVLPDRMEPHAVINIELDERAFLMPNPKQLTHLHIMVFRPSTVRIEGIFLYNASNAPTELVELGVTDANELASRLIGSVYRAQSSIIVTKTASLSVNVVTNGYIIQFGDLDRQRELFLSTASIWRVCNGLARAVDFLSHSAQH